jgi:hypothetical protein
MCRRAGTGPFIEWASSPSSTPPSPRRVAPRFQPVGSCAPLHPLHISVTYAVRSFVTHAVRSRQCGPYLETCKGSFLTHRGRLGAGVPASRPNWPAKHTKGDQACSSHTLEKGRSRFICDPSRNIIPAYRVRPRSSQKSSRSTSINLLAFDCSARKKGPHVWRALFYKRLRS